jgi:flagellar motor switch protein FliG
VASLERLETLNERQIQDWLRKVDLTTPAVALLGVSDSVKEKVLGNLSKNASTALDQIMCKYGSLDAKELVIQSRVDRLETLT